MKTAKCNNRGEGLNVKKVDVRVKRTYKQLSDALLRLLKQKSFDEIKVLEICQEAEVHRATFYKHFVDKYDFLHTCFQLKLSELDLDHSSGKYSSESLKQSLNDMLIMVVHFAEENHDFISFLSIDKYSTSFVNTLHDAISHVDRQDAPDLPPLREEEGRHVPGPPAVR